MIYIHTYIHTCGTCNFYYIINLGIPTTNWYRDPYMYQYVMLVLVWHTRTSTHTYMYMSVTPEEIRYVRPQVAPNELGQGGSTARQVLTKFCISYWYVGPYMLEEWPLYFASGFGSLRICCCMVRVVCCTFRGPRLGRFGFWSACVPQPNNRSLPARLLLFFGHLFRQESCTTYR